jgi:methionyl-tRNA synthetase
VLRESKHWFFNLPKLADKLQRYVEGNANLPDNARNSSLSWIREGLKPRSLTRDISWGIPAPFDGAEGKTMYVWMEAVLGYVSATKEWSKKTGRPELWKKYWLDAESHNVHFIGKDNITFHTIIFPGLLEASEQGYSLPWQVSSTEYVQFEGSKFSKSKKIGVWMDEALELEDSEYWRYALISLRPELRDVNFTWEEFERKVNTELNDVLGNFVHRTLSFVQTHFGGVVPKYDPQNNQDKDLLQTLQKQSLATDSAMQEFRLKEALENIVDLARVGNRYMNETEPWNAYKQSEERAGQIIGLSIQVVGSLSVLLQPFLPKTSSRILRGLVKKKDLPWKYSGNCFIPHGTRIARFEPLFHKVSAIDLRDRLAKLRSTDTNEAEV